MSARFQMPKPVFSMTRQDIGAARCDSNAHHNNSDFSYLGYGPSIAAPHLDTVSISRAPSKSRADYPTVCHPERVRWTPKDLSRKYTASKSPLSAFNKNKPS
jgi:hypothetical protein